jgi:hypothetical protein
VKIEPLPGVRPSTILTLLDDALNKATVLTSRDKYESLDNYLRWASDTARALSGLVRPVTVDWLVLTRRHWALMTTDPAASQALLTLVNNELAECTSAMREARSRLSDEINRWDAAQGQLIVADTNVFLEHRDEFLDIPWRGLVRAAENEPVRLVRGLEGAQPGVPRSQR